MIKIDPTERPYSSDIDVLSKTIVQRNEVQLTTKTDSITALQSYILGLGLPLEDDIISQISNILIRK